MADHCEENMDATENFFNSDDSIASDSGSEYLGNFIVVFCLLDFMDVIVPENSDADCISDDESQDNAPHSDSINSPIFLPRKPCGFQMPKNARSGNKGSEPRAFFLFVFTPQLLESIVSETNRYSIQRRARLDVSSQIPTGQVAPFAPVDVVDMEVFIGLVLSMGILKLPAIRDYWSSDELYNGGSLSSFMSRNRFEEIFWNLHLCDNTSMPKRGEEGFDRLFKVRGYLNSLCSSFQRCFRPFQRVAVDEMMIPFKGRSSLKQYMPMKPVKRGFKIWAACDCNTSYLFNFIVYEGKGSIVNDDLGLGGSVVMHLMEEYLGENRIVYSDNYFTSVPLCNSLMDNATHCCGTTRHSRKDFPAVAKVVADKKAGIRKAQKGTIRMEPVGSANALGWMDKRDVHMLSTFHGDETVSIDRRQSDGTEKREQIPQVIREYNKYMRAVDIMDQRRGSYECTRKSKRWWLRFFWWGLDTVVINSWLMYNHFNENEYLSQLDFRKNVVRAMLEQNPIQKSPVGRPRKQPRTSLPARLTERHFISLGSKRRNCVQCERNGNRTQPKYYCPTCNVGLCVDKCFELWHTKL